jgi:hypothetical protein
MGGTLPMGYDLRERKLVVNHAEARTVRHIFERYFELSSIRLHRPRLKGRAVSGLRQLRTRIAAFCVVAIRFISRIRDDPAGVWRADQEIRLGVARWRLSGSNVVPVAPPKKADTIVCTSSSAGKKAWRSASA